MTSKNYSYGLLITLHLMILMLASVGNLRAQQTPSADALFQEARTAAFDRKDYSKAIELSKQALKLSPDYTDISVFMGRVYTWSGKPDSAKAVFEKVLQTKPGDQDASLAYANLEYWNKNPQKALEITKNGLSTNPKSKELLLLEAKLYETTGQMDNALQTLDTLLELDPKNTEGRALAILLNNNGYKNKVEVNYEYLYFDKQFPDPWHLLSLEYGRRTGIGPVNARANLANRFGNFGTQFEAEAYPRISKTFYTYVAGGYCANEGVFPKYRAGFSLYANLPAGFEAEAGYRLLHFTDNTNIYTFSIGKYLKNYWFSFRGYLTPSNSNISQSYNLLMRYYYGGANDYFTLRLGTGISPDNTANNILLNNSYKLRSNTIAADFRHAFKSNNIIILGASWQKNEYQKDVKGNQINLNIGLQKRF